MAIRNFKRTTVIGPSTKGLSSGGVEVSTPGESIQLTSNDGSVRITPNAAQGKIDLKAMVSPDSLITDKVSITKTAFGAVSALKVLRAYSSTQVAYANPAGSYEEAVAFGVSTTGAISGSQVSLLVFGQINDASFTWPTNTLLFLGPNGALTSTAPSTGYLVRVGRSLGVGSIIVEISEPILLG